ncbi:aldo/keto reductase [Haliovirga abyssi]|uniref:Oxidoreductase n=1 Tax=Haliovirga abyssi TaxID=2996794 RepID=A0AAU9DYV2_9FUSO|nr:aldo/keto reductase [Haliovirga abyssi]BDU51706.1 oxidoreductase [Haliovirga abyssi]
MKRVKISEDLSISRIIHGYWRLNDWDLSKEEVLSLIKKDIDSGITTFDHADIYGGYSVERKFGDIISMDPRIRDKIEIITKCGIQLKADNRPNNWINHYDTSKKHIIESVKKSLRNFRTNYIDILLIHRPDPFMNPEEVAEAFLELKKAGKVREFGVSNFLPSQVNMLQSYLDFPITVNQVEISALQVEQFYNGTIENCFEKRITPLAWSPLAGGEIFKGNSEKVVRVRKTLEKIAKEHNISGIDVVMYSWLLMHPAKIVPIVGSSKWDRIRAAMYALEIKLSRQEWFEILEAANGNQIP